MKWPVVEDDIFCILLVHCGNIGHFPFFWEIALRDAIFENEDKWDDERVVIQFDHAGREPIMTMRFLTFSCLISSLTLFGVTLTALTE